MVSYVPGLSLLPILASAYTVYSIQRFFLPPQLTAVQYIQVLLLLLLLLLHGATARLAQARELAPGRGLGCAARAHFRLYAAAAALLQLLHGCLSRRHTPVASG